MGEQTAIEWATATWNPWQGCTKVSPGCTHCYMYREKGMYGQNPRLVVRSKTVFHAPLRWKEPQPRVFTCSWSDWFHEAADPWRAEAWDIIRRTPRHTYLILTKRPERIPACLPPLWGLRGWANVWLGTSVESQAYVERLDQLLAIPAPVHFLSAEPLLGPLHVGKYLTYDRGRRALRWVIVGGESGPQWRPMDLLWARSLRDQCVAAGVPFFFKQHSGLTPKALGRELDGVEWNQLPA